MNCLIVYILHLVSFLYDNSSYFTMVVVVLCIYRSLTHQYDNYMCSSLLLCPSVCQNFCLSIYLFVSMLPTSFCLATNLTSLSSSVIFHVALNFVSCICVCSFVTTSLSSCPVFISFIMFCISGSKRFY